MRVSFPTGPRGVLGLCQIVSSQLCQGRRNESRPPRLCRKSIRGSWRRVTSGNRTSEGAAERRRKRRAHRGSPLLRADFCDGIVAPLPLLAQQRAAISCGTAGTRCGDLLAHGAARDRTLVAFHSKRKSSCRVRRSNRHGNCKHRHSESLQHCFFLPYAVTFVKDD